MRLLGSRTSIQCRELSGVFQLFEKLVDGGKTILMVTHDEDLARRVTRAVTIADGQIAADTKSARALRNAAVRTQHAQGERAEGRHFPAHFPLRPQDLLAGAAAD